MSPRDWRERLDDILQAVANTQQYTDGMTFEEFSGDQKTVHAVTYNIAIIGEAARHVPAEVQARYPEVPWPQMRGIRNVVTHHYFGVNLPILWQTVRHDLPLLVPTLREILAREP
ncbi:MAG: DUF86 domain-containing protein [Chloroflexi bacterium]|nr:DUF86 domain-containing protein [Chloroflexota bacterium]